jgi:hypothetical protein
VEEFEMRKTKEFHECLWMVSGVSPYRNCIHEYECYDCPYDRAMRKYKKSWRDVMRENHADSRWCRHMLTGTVGYKICVHDYRCGNCEFDQMIFEENLANH